MKRKTKSIFILIVFFVLIGAGTIFNSSLDSLKRNFKFQNPSSSTLQRDKEGEEKSNPMAIESLKAHDFSDKELQIEETLRPGSNYQRFLASYNSEGLTINGLLTVPNRQAPEGGYPAVIFMHGYIPPTEYSTTESYPTYPARLARQGFVVFKPDLRGHGNSEGEPVNSHFSEKYVVDTLNALTALENYEKINPERIGYWGHSNGGEIGLRLAVVTSDIQAYSFWAGVVGSYEDMLETYNEQIPFLQDIDSELIKEHGLPSENPSFWQRVDPYFHLQNIKAPIQLQHATGDEDVPEELSISLKNKLEKLDKEVQYFEYEGDNHNIAQNQDKAWSRTITFFKDNL